MNKSRLLINLCIIAQILFNVACTLENEISQKDNNGNKSSELEGESSANANNKSIFYELSGDFSGKLDVTFLSSNISAPNQIKGITIPWDFSYSVPDSIQAIGGFANGLYGDATPGETAYLKMFLNDKLIETVVRTSDEDGNITLPLESYIMEYDDSQKTISQTNIGKDISYTIEGDFSGKIMLVYKIADGSAENIIKAELPWTYNFKTTENSNKVSIYGLGSNGIENEEIVFSLIIDNKVFKSERVLTDKEGRIGLFPEIVLEFE